MTDVVRRYGSGGALSGLAAAGILASSLGLSGCGAEDMTRLEPDLTALDPAVSRYEEPVGDEVLLGAADVGYGTVRFHQQDNADGTVSVFISEEASNRVVHTPLERAVLQGHTNLELFTALLPEEPAPESLIASHAAEVLSLGRPDGDLRIPDLDADMSVEKSAASCGAWVYQDPADDECFVNSWGNGRRIDNTSGDKALHVGQNWGFATTSNVTMGICNESDVAVRGRMGVDVGGDDSSAYAMRGWATVRVGGSWRWYNFRTVNIVSPPDCPPAPQLCLPFTHASRYRVEGSSPGGKVYHLKTAELQSTMKEECIPR